MTKAGAPDGFGGLYVSGDTLGSLGGPNLGYYDVWLGRYDGSGHRMWILHLGTTGFDLAYGAASDGSGGVYLCGYTEGSLGGPNVGGTDAWIAHYDGLGTPLWIRQLGSFKQDFARASAADGSGGVYVSGDTHGSLGASSAGTKDVWLARYDRAGSQLWMRQFGTTKGDVAQAAAEDPARDVYIAGYTNGSLAAVNAGSSDAFLARFDFAGNLLWTRQLGTDDLDESQALSPDGAGGVFVAGRTAGSLAGASAGNNDAWLARYDSLGRG